jgi:hypothetical protein
MKNKWLLKSALLYSLSLPGQGCTMHSAKLADTGSAKWADTGTVSKIEMNLSAFGVESDGAPNIRAIVDIKNDTSYCNVSYYDPRFRAFTYRLTKTDMDSIRSLIARCDIRKLKKEYTVASTDQPSSITIFYLPGDSVRISDYGCEGPSPLHELYLLVYKPEKTVR